MSTANAAAASVEAGAETRAKPTFEQVLEHLYREYKGLEIEYRKLAEYKKLADQYRLEEERRYAGYKKLADDYVRLEGAYKNLQTEYGILAENGKADSSAKTDGSGVSASDPWRFYNTLLLRACPDAVLVLDNDLRVVLVTDMMARLLGESGTGTLLYSNLGNMLKTIMAPHEMELVTQNCRTALKTSRQVSFTSILTPPGGSEIIAECTVSPASENGIIYGVVFLIHDVTEMEAAKRRAEEASNSKSSFLATVSHEIRTPLNAVLGLSEIELQKELAGDTRDNLEKIYSSGSSLLGIINDILDISKIEAGSMDIVPTNYNMSGLLGTAIQLNLVRIGVKKITFDLDMDPDIPEKLYGDELRVKQILNNLLSNAFKYTEEGFVKLTVVWREDGENAYLTFTVSDSGQGIRKEDLGKLFSEYKQLNSRANRNIEGTGLGLSITRKLTELMGGALSVESEFGKGSSFKVSLPQKIVDLTPVGEDAIKNLKEFRFAEFRNRMKKNLIRSYMPYGKVLVVDDVLTNLEVARGLMLPYGLTIDCVSSGQEAVEKVKNTGVSGVPPYDVVLMDHMMPDMDGIETTKAIRGEIGTDYARTVPIIALTANAMAGIEEMFMKNGFNGYISKPIDIMRLDVELNKWIRDRHGSKEQVKSDSAAEAAPHAAGAPPGRRAASGPIDAHVDGVDLAEGYARYEDENIYLGVLRTYVKSTPQLLNKMRIISRDKLSDYAVTIHGIKGSSYGICAMTAGKWAERLEAAAKNGDLELVLSENSDFIRMMERLMSSLSQFLDGSAKKEESLKQPSPGRNKVFEPDRQVLEKMFTACKQYDLNAMDQYLMELEGFDYEFGSELVSGLREQMDNLEYDAILDHLSRTLTSSRKH
ncbi:MAG: response regulator [Synergistaceae bacterium]|jgi:PAS domain S-box-containing protein|nr:response regulator [Synergistaceae bacterium]